MTHERGEPGIWRRGEAFEITWRDAHGAMPRARCVGDCAGRHHGRSEGAHRCRQSGTVASARAIRA
jgi:hypothetical protein